jgi:hypothetical protein
MNIRPISATQAGAAAPETTARPRARTAPAPAAPAAGVAALSTPAATVSTTSVPASVKPEDRSLYLQILKSVGGNVAAALGALQAKEAAEAAS